jgi:hypothetical protein
MMLAGAVMLWISSDNGRAVAVPTRPPAADAELAGPFEALPLPEAEEPDLSMPDEPVLKAPRAPVKSREEQRFDRVDRNRDGRIQQAEFLAARKRNFDRLDVNGDGVLSFAEYAASGIRRFAELDTGGDGTLSRAEFAASAPAQRTRTAQAAAGDDCDCTNIRTAAAGGHERQARGR